METLPAAPLTFGGSGTSGSMIVRRLAGKRVLVLHASPATVELQQIQSRTAAALVLIMDPGGLPRIDPNLVAAVYHLTPAQSRVAVVGRRQGRYRDRCGKSCHWPVLRTSKVNARSFIRGRESDPLQDSPS